MDEGFDRNLQAALETRPVIEQAKGVLMVLRGGSPDQAFEELSYASQKHNIKLYSLATGLIDCVCGRPVGDEAAKAALEAQWGNLLPRRSRPRRIESRESA
jgi:hypothetical protein